MSVTNKNMLSPTGFAFNLKRAPSVNFFVQGVSVPGVSLNTFEVSTPLKNLPTAGDKLEYEQLQITFKVDEDMVNYLEIFNWIKALGFPDTYDQYKTIKDRTRYSGESMYSDGSILVLTSASNPNIQIDFQDLFPVSLTALELTASDTQIAYIDATASFAFRSLTFTKL